MIAVVQALNYKCLRYIRQKVEHFQILVGPNASGKSTFLDVIGLLGEFLDEGLTETLHHRSKDFKPLIWMHEGNSFSLAVELAIPKKLPRLNKNHKKARYEIELGFNSKGELTILDETLWLIPETKTQGASQEPLFPYPPSPPPQIVIPERAHAPRGWRRVVSKKPTSGNDYFQSEMTGWNNLFRLGPLKSTLAGLPEDKDKFPIAIWVKRTLMEGVKTLVLNSEEMRSPSPPGAPKEFQPDGSNLPWVIHSLQERNQTRFKKWIEHLQVALPDLVTIETVEREEDRHRYLRLKYASGLEVPSWLVSDGTLRMLALTLLPYLDQEGRIYLIEEPENGIHPKAIELVFQSLSSVYDSQVLCASHSPVFLGLAEPNQLLCFAKDKNDAVAIVNGTQHPRLREFRKGMDLGVLFAAGVLST